MSKCCLASCAGEAPLHAPKLRLHLSPKAAMTGERPVTRGSRAPATAQHLLHKLEPALPVTQAAALRHSPSGQQSCTARRM